MNHRPPFSVAGFNSWALAFVLACGATCRSVAAALPPPLPAPASQDQKMAWFHEAKFGLFIHWGIYSIPGGEWHGKPIRPSSEWIMAHARIPVKEYEPLAREFNPVQFNAEEWVQLAQDAGMKYMVITAKHGDGFAMYHSHVSAYNIYDATPFHRDPMRELAEACARHGIKFGFYYSQAVDWHEPGGSGNTWDFSSDAEKNKNGAYDNYLQTKCEPQVRELLSNYGPICELFFDTPAMFTLERGQRFVDLVHTLQPACLIDGRLGAPGDYATMGDNGIPNANVQGDWETPATMNHNWGFSIDDSDWKSPSQVIFNLMDIVSKGGNYLLNVGPNSLGIIPVVCQSNLLTVGRWLKVNGAAVYGAGRSPFGEAFGDDGRSPKNEKERPVHLPFTTWRCTTADGKLYFTIFNWSSGGFKLPAFKNEIKRAYLLCDPDRTDIPLGVTNEVRYVQTPHYAPTVMPNVLALEIKGGKVER